MNGHRSESVPREEYLALKRELEEKERLIALQSEALDILREKTGGRPDPGPAGRAVGHPSEYGQRLRKRPPPPFRRDGPSPERDPRDQGRVPEIRRQTFPLNAGPG